MDQKLKMLVVLALLFMVVSAPQVYGLTNSLANMVGQSTVSMSGRPNVVGIVLHGVVFALLVRALMEIPDLEMC